MFTCLHTLNPPFSFSLLETSYSLLLILTPTPMSLTTTRDHLLHLHKALLDYQKAAYEATHPAVQNPNHYYQLVLGDPAFVWLRTLSALVVSIDELLEKPAELTDAKEAEIATYTRRLLTISNQTDEFSTNYQAAIGNSETVAALHAQVLQVLDTKAA